MGFADRLRLVSMVLLPHLIGRFLLETTVRPTTPGDWSEVLHTTRVSKWGMTVMATKESFRLSDNGLDLTVDAELGLWPFLRRVGPFQGTGSIDQSAASASYVFSPWFGTQMHQTAVATANTVELVQDTPWSHGVQRLQRA